MHRKNQLKGRVLTTTVMLVAAVAIVPSALAASAVKEGAKCTGKEVGRTRAGAGGVSLICTKSGSKTTWQKLPAPVTTVAGAPATTPVAKPTYTDPGITDTEITFGQSWPLTGPAGAVYKPLNDSMNGYIKWVNDNGGVKMGDGKTRKIVVKTLDDGFDPAKGLENARKLVEGDKVFSMFFNAGTPVNTVISGYTEPLGVPNVLISSSSEKWGDLKKYPNTIGFQALGITEGAIWAKWLTENMKGAKVAMLQDNSDFGRSTKAIFESTLADLNSTVKLVATQTYETTDPTVDSQITNLAASGANVFMNIATLPTASKAIKRIAETNWRPTQIVSLVSNGVGSALAPAGYEAADGVLTTFFLKDPADPKWNGDPWVINWRSVMAKNAPSVNQKDILNLFACVMVEALVDNLQQMKTPTRAGLMDSVRHMNFEIGGLLPGVKAITSPTDPYPIESLALGQFNSSTKQYVLFNNTIVNGEGKTPKPSS